MRKFYIWALVIGVLLATASCNRRTEEDIYGTTESVEVSSETAAQAETTIASTQAETTTVAEPTTTVAEEVYDDEGSATETVNEDDIDREPVASTIEDPAFEASILTFLDPVYYNLFFGHGNYVDGIMEEDMIKFAISYIYQHEYNELKFDTTDFILFVPEKRVEEIVERYFDFSVTGHHSFIEDNLMYEDGYYLMPAVDAGWNDVMTIESATATGDFSYEIIFNVTNEMDETQVAYKTGIEVRNDRYVLMSYTLNEAVEAEE